MSTDQPDSAPSEGSDGQGPTESGAEGTNRNAVLVAGVALVAVIVIAAVLLLGGGDDDGEDVSLGSTTSDAISTTDSSEVPSTVAVPTSNDAAAGQPKPTVSTQPSEIPNLTDSPAEQPGSDLPESIQPIAPGEVRPAPDQPLVGDGRMQQLPASEVVGETNGNLNDLPFATVLSRLDQAEISDNPCVKLNALPRLSGEQVSGYFSRWQNEAAAVSGSVDEELAPILTTARVAMSQIQDIVDREGGGQFQDPANQLLLDPGTQFLTLYAFGSAVGHSCPPPQP